MELNGFQLPCCRIDVGRSVFSQAFLSSEKVALYVLISEKMGVRVANGVSCRFFVSRNAKILVETAGSTVNTYSPSQQRWLGAKLAHFEIMRLASWPPSGFRLGMRESGVSCRLGCQKLCRFISKRRRGISGCANKF